MKLAVIYASKYGSTKDYATWIAQALDAPLFQGSALKGPDLAQYDLVIYGGGLYGGKINGIELVTKNPCPPLVLFTVGMMEGGAETLEKILAQNLPEGLRERTKAFHLRGELDYGKLSLVHRGMMAAFVKMLKGKKEKSEEVKAIIAGYGGHMDYRDQATIAPLVNYVKETYEIPQT